MNGKTTLKRLERLAQRRPHAPATYADYERARLEAMTDDELARNLERLAQVLKILDDAGALDDVLDADMLELLQTAEL